MDDKKRHPARWRRYNDVPVIYRLRQSKTDLVAVQKQASGKWFWHTVGGHLPLRNTATQPVETLEAAKAEAEEWVSKHA